MALEVAFEHRLVDALIITLFAFEWFVASMIELVVFEVVFVFCDKLAQVAREQFVRIEMHAHMRPTVYLLVGFVAALPAYVHALFGHLCAYSTRVRRTYRR